MNAFRECWPVATLVVVLVAPGCSATSGTLTDTAASSTSELEALYWARKDSALTRVSQADVDFMTGMIGHHAQALIMAAFAPSHGANPEVQRLCARIINAQKDEIVTMQTWLQDRGQAVPEIQIEGRMLMLHGVDEHNVHMPGMLSSEQLQQLDEARDSDFDKLFLVYMIQHHNGAVAMVEELFGKDGAAQDEIAFKVANDINVDQITEIARMERMLDILNDSDKSQ